MRISSLDNRTEMILLDALLNFEIEETLLSCFTEISNRSNDAVILDFRPVDSMDSTGVSALVKLIATAKRHKRKLYAYGLSNRYQEIFSLTGLDKGLTVINRNNPATIPPDLTSKIEKTSIKAGKQSDAGWAPNMEKLHITEKPEGAFVKNMDGFRITGQIQGFGPMWEKTYWLEIEQPELSKEEVMLTLQEHFIEFQPRENKFYPTSKGLIPGEIIFIDSRTPGGIVSTGVMVLYKDERSFSFITPQGHPEAGWVTFSVDNQQDSIYVQIQGLVRSSDPFFEIAFALVGSKFQETIWKHVLSSFARYLGVEENIHMKKYAPATDIQWSKAGNIWFNSQLRSLPLNITSLFSRRHRIGQR